MTNEYCEYSTEELLEWIGIFRDIDEKEAEPARFCVFVERDPDEKLYQTGIAKGFATADEAAKRRVEYYDLTPFEDVEKTAYHLGTAEELYLRKLEHLAACYVPEYIGRSADDYHIIIGHFKDEDAPRFPKVNYSFSQQMRVCAWLSLFTWLNDQQNVIVTNDVGTLTDDLLETHKFLNEKKEIDRSGLFHVMSTIFCGRAADIDLFTIDTLADWELERVGCTSDGVLALLGTEAYYG